jgi:uncharacterized repeat protein (TIGR03803 family)
MMSRPSAIHRPQVSGALALAGLVWVAAAISAPSVQAQTYTVLYRFNGGINDGENPQAGLLDEAGNFYGTTVTGPGCKPTACSPSPGMVYKIDTTGAETVVHRFTGAPSGCGTAGNPACDGANPYAGLIPDTSNNLYGTTSAGGTSDLGTVFKLGASGETVLHSFTGAPGDGAFPYAGVIRDSAGNLYGTTSAGGASNSGAVFKIDTSGTETLLYSFTGGPEGGTPYGGLIRTSAGGLYGTTSAGGIATGNCFPSGCGVVFVVDTAGNEHVLYSFTGSPDGASPYAGLTADSGGDLYGTTYNGGTGGCTNGCGVVFELDKAGTETVLHSFAGYPTDGAFPLAGLAHDSAGDLYGTTAYGGASDNGAVFELVAAGTETMLYSFKGTTDGAVPRAGLILDSSGNLYGTTYNGGVSGARCGGETADTCGVVFKLEP